MSYICACANGIFPSDCTRQTIEEEILCFSYKLLISNIDEEQASVKDVFADLGRTGSLCSQVLA